MVSVSLCGQVRMRAGKLFIHNPDGVFEVRVDKRTESELLDLSRQNEIIIGGTIRTHKGGSYIDLQTYQLTDDYPDPTDHLNTLLRISLGAN